MFSLGLFCRYQQRSPVAWGPDEMSTLEGTRHNRVEVKWNEESMIDFLTTISFRNILF